MCTVGLRACMGCGTGSSFTSKPPKRSQSFEEDPLQFAFSSKIRDESCAAQSPFLDRRKSGHIHPRQHASKHRYDRKPKLSKPPAPSLHRFPILSQAVRRHGHGWRCTVSRQSKIGPVTIPRQHACKHRYGRKPKVSKPPAPSHHRSPTLSQTVCRHGHGPITFSRQSKIRSRHHPTPSVRASIGMAGNPR